MNISREAVEAAAVEAAGMVIAKFRDGPTPSTDIARAVLAAALPHLVSVPIQSDEEQAEEIARAFTPVDMGGTVKPRAERILAFAAAVRAEATLAEREACAKVVLSYDRADEPDELINRIAAAIRART
jgi:hypothetical protein